MEIDENTTPSTRDIIHAGFENLGRAKELLSEVCSAGISNSPSGNCSANWRIARIGRGIGRIA